MKKKLMGVIATILVLCSLTSCKNKDVVQTTEITNKITQSSVILTDRLAENNDFSTFLKSYKSSHTVPGLLEGVIPQGVCYDETTGYLLITGYYEDSKYPSVLMVLDEKNGKLLNYYSLKKINGEDYYGHAGGIASSQNTIYIVSEGECYTFPADTLLNEVKQSYIQFQSNFKLNTKGSFACYSNNTLWIGDFIQSDDKERKAVKDITTLESGETFYAYCEGYKLVDGLPDVNKINKDSTGYIPDYYMAIPEQVQGMAFTKTGKILFSTSYGRKNNSKIYVFDDIISKEATETKIVNGEQVDFYSCKSSLLLSEIIAPPMAEGMANTPDKIYIMFESGAEKYRCDGGKYPTETLFVTTIE